ncbi:hypothetical protein J1N35_022591 [Gossypium stocksii]|uniref:Putative plant transposon protein domain-containing protein n=1 Tax=Gossypium stocksii TaxID=47602 RepID=A0A9D3VGR6_9ROSI|nr:hypothetical protein J1N35_022591 [Gossypium stocksii]
MPRKRTRASAQINETQNKFHCEEAKLSIKPEKLQEILEELTVPGSKWSVSKQGIHTCRREYLTPLAKVWFYFIRFILMPSSHGTTISLERMVLLYSILTGKTIDLGKIILRDEAEPMEPEVEPKFKTLTFGAPPPSSNVRDKLSKLIDLMQHMQLQQQAY